ncbi:MAG: multicopper oxidase domain-containing protein [Chloroflexi bacterium]|nr:multicopper oxidase domain-containing protein [Chloroflexota bacterium]
MLPRRLLGIFMVSAVLAGACAPATGAPTWTYTPGKAAAAATPAASQGQTASGDVLGTLEVRAVDLGFEPKSFSVTKAGRYEVKLTNSGAIAHYVTFSNGTTTGLVKPSETKSVTVDVPSGGISFICSVPGHADAGMKASITAAGGTAAGGEGGGSTGGGATAEVQPDPNAPAYVLNPAAAPALLPGTTHDIVINIEEKAMTVANGFVQKVWTFEGTVPGPVIRVKVGDKVRITLKNPTSNAVPHSIDFHSSQVAWNDEMTSINPGEEKIYEWRADYAGVWMYHCGTAPALHHIANGMFGMVIVEPKEGLPPVDAEFAVVQSEWYLGPQGQISSLAKAAAAAPAPDFVVFNGIANQYKDNPIKVATGARVRVFVLNAGPSIDSSFHVVGTIFSSVIKEGISLLPGNSGNWGAQAMDLSPAQGGIVEFVMPEDGLYPMVTHAFNLVGRGALGLFQAGDGNPKN